MSKVLCPPRSGKCGNEVFVNTRRWGVIVRRYVRPRNPRSPAQQTGRQAFGSISSQWKNLSLDAQNAWYLAAEAHRVNLSGYHYYMSLNRARANVGLARLELPPTTAPAFPVNPVGQAAVEGSGETLRIKLPVAGQPAELTLVEVAAPVSAGVRNAQGYRYVGLLPAPVNGVSDITAPVLARFGVLVPGNALFIRTRQQINGWMDTGKITRVLIPRG